MENKSVISPFDGQEVFYSCDTSHKKKPVYKIHHDGSNYVATLFIKNSGNISTERKKKDNVDVFFDSKYIQAVAEGLKGARLNERLHADLSLEFPQMPKLDDYTDENIKKRQHNLYNRKKRFKRKANLNEWNYFCTYTFDSKKLTDVQFKKRFRKCLCNLHTRYGWRYMGVFENAPTTGRLHFHGLFYIPENAMVGTISEKTDYNKSDGKMQTIHINSFFAERFGRNDFAEVTEMELQCTNVLDYILKYIGKDNGKIVYSRGIRTEIYKELIDSQICCDYFDFVTKFVLFDDVIDWGRDVLHFKPLQLSLYDNRTQQLACG